MTLNPAEKAGKVSERLEYLRAEIQAERISYSQISELQSLASHIEPGDVELLEWAGVPEFCNCRFQSSLCDHCTAEALASIED